MWNQRYQFPGPDLCVCMHSRCQSTVFTLTWLIATCAGPFIVNQWSVKGTKHLKNRHATALVTRTKDQYVLLWIDLGTLRLKIEIGNVFDHWWIGRLLKQGSIYGWRKLMHVHCRLGKVWRGMHFPDIFMLCILSRPASVVLHYENAKLTQTVPTPIKCSASGLILTLRLINTASLKHIQCVDLLESITISRSPPHQYIYSSNFIGRLVTVTWLIISSATCNDKCIRR